MVNWKAANYASGIFSVLVFVITTILFIMYITQNEKYVQRLATAVATKATEIANSDNKPVQETAPQQSPQEATMKGGAQTSTIVASVLELCALCFSAIIWGLTFGQARTGY